MEPECHKLARRQLKENDIDALEICIALPDSIVFRNLAGQVMTAWTRLRNDKEHVQVVSVAQGMPPWPPIPEEES
jgi:hypothetical protein